MEIPLAMDWFLPARSIAASGKFGTMNLRGDPQTFRIRQFGLANDASDGLLARNYVLGQDLRHVPSSLKIIPGYS